MAEWILNLVMTGRGRYVESKELPKKDPFASRIMDEFLNLWLAGDFSVSPLSKKNSSDHWTTDACDFRSRPCDEKRHKSKELTGPAWRSGHSNPHVADFPDAPEVEEDGTTCEANAIKEGLRDREGLTGLRPVSTIPVGSGALDGRPLGVYAARYSGEHATYEDNCRKLVQELAGVSAERRTASIYHGGGHRRTGEPAQVTQGF